MGEARVARIDGGGQRTTVDSVRIQNGPALANERIGRALKDGQTSVAVNEKAKHWKHAFERSMEPCREFDTRLFTGLAQGEEVHQYSDEFGRTSTCMPAVGQDLSVKPFRKQLQSLCSQRFQAL